MGEGLDPLRGSGNGQSVQSMRCAAGKGSTLMSVTVTAPNGLSETVFSQVLCGSKDADVAFGAVAESVVQKIVAQR